MPQSEQETGIQRRLGFMQGEILVPDDFDRLLFAQATAEDYFNRFKKAMEDLHFTEKEFSQVFGGIKYKDLRDIFKLPLVNRWIV